MILIYGKQAVGKAVARLCDALSLVYEMCDESDAPAHFEKYDMIIPSP